MFLMLSSYLSVDTHLKDKIATTAVSEIMRQKKKEVEQAQKDGTDFEWSSNRECYW